MEEAPRFKPMKRRLKVKAITNKFEFEKDLQEDM
jgi:hypothetical protein